jgi:hypothetical protein
MTLKTCDKCGKETDAFYYLVIKRKDSISVNNESSKFDLCEKCARKLTREADTANPQERKSR